MGIKKTDEAKANAKCFCCGKRPERLDPLPDKWGWDLEDPNCHWLCCPKWHHNASEFDKIPEVKPEPNEIKTPRCTSGRKLWDVSLYCKPVHFWRKATETVEAETEQEAIEKAKTIALEVGIPIDGPYEAKATHLTPP